MAGSGTLDTFIESYETFRVAASAVPDELFLTPMEEGGWSPHDTVAHLVDWTREMIQAGRDLLAGKTPYYYSERTIDYRDMNARFVAAHASEDKSALLAGLARTEAELVAFARSLDPAEMDADHGVVHYRGGPATVATTLNSLGSDYRHHAGDIRAWLDAKKAQA
jgi:hypothetical protein